MRSATICVLFITLIVVAMVAGIAVGFFSGLFTIQGTDVIVNVGRMNIRQGVRIINSDPILVEAPIYFFVAMLVIPLALIAIIAVALVGRNSRPRE